MSGPPNFDEISRPKYMHEGTLRALETLQNAGKEAQETDSAWMKNLNAARCVYKDGASAYQVAKWADPLRDDTFEGEKKDKLGRMSVLTLSILGDTCYHAARALRILDQEEKAESIKSQFEYTGLAGPGDKRVGGDLPSDPDKKQEELEFLSKKIRDNVSSFVEGAMRLRVLASVHGQDRYLGF